MGVHLNYEKALEMRELAFDEARRHDSSMLQKRKVLLYIGSSIKDIAARIRVG
jgi:hypothetical protein